MYFPKRLKIKKRLYIILAVFLGALLLAGCTEPAGVAWEKKIEVASGGGYQGPWRMNESVFDYIDSPIVAVNEQGFTGVAWVDQSQKDIFFQLYTPDGKEQLEKPVNVSGTPRVFSWLPRMIVTSTDPIKVFILWQEIVFSGGTHGGEIFFARSKDGGKTFSDPLNLSNDIAGSGKGRLTSSHWDNGSLDIAMGPKGNLYAVWTEYEGTLWFSRSTDGGESFSFPFRVAGGGDRLPARGPSLAIDTTGNVYLAWTVGGDRAADIHFAKSVDRGRSFSVPRIVFKNDGHCDAPKIAVDGKGIVHLVYAESPVGLFEQYDIRYTRSFDGGNTFKVPREISSPQTEKPVSGNFPALSLGGGDNLYVIWELFPDRKYRPWGLGFTYSNDGGQTFVPVSTIPGSMAPAGVFNGGLQGSLTRKLAVNTAGEVAVVNSTFKPYKMSRVWLFRGRAVR